MAAISTWSKVAASNNATPPDGWPEGQNPSTVNDCAREMMAALRTRFEDLEWFNHGHVLVQQSANSFLVSSTCTEIYTAGRRVKLYDATTIYGDVIASSPSGANTLITVSCSALTASLSSGEVGIINPANLSLPSLPSMAKGFVMAGPTGNIIVSENVTSVTDVGVGKLRVTWATDFSTANYVVNVSVRAQTALSPMVDSSAASPQLAGSVDLLLIDVANSPGDPIFWYVSAFGDQ